MQERTVVPHLLDPPTQLMAELYNLRRPPWEDVTPLRMPLWGCWELFVTQHLMLIFYSFSFILQN